MAVYQVHLNPDGSLAAEMRAVGHPLPYLGCRLDLGAGCRLRSYFYLMQRYPVLTELSDFFTVLQMQYDQCPADGCLWPDLKGLQFSKAVEMIGYPGKPRLEIYHRLQGLGAESTAEIRQLPLNVLLDMPLSLGPLEHQIFGDRMDAMQFDTVYTLFEFIDGLSWALSFHGTPPQCLTRS